MSTDSTRYEYVSEPTRGVSILMLVIIAAALLVPLPESSSGAQWNTLIRLLVLSIGLGILIWVGLQWLVRGRGVQLKPDHLLIETTFTRNIRRIPYTYMRGCTLTERGGLVIAYEEPVKRVTPGAKVALTELRANLDRDVKKHLLVTPPLTNAPGLAESLAEHITQTIPADVLSVRVARRRLRRGILALLAFLGTPIYVIVLSRIISAFMKGL